MKNHVNAGLCLDIDDLAVSIQMDLVSGPEFGLGENAVLGDQGDIFGADIGGQRLGGVIQIAQATDGGFLLPLLVL